MVAPKMMLLSGVDCVSLNSFCMGDSLGCVTCVGSGGCVSADGPNAEGSVRFCSVGCVDCVGSRRCVCLGIKKTSQWNIRFLTPIVHPALA